MENKKVIILGSSRSKGNTSKVVELYAKENQIDIIDLNQFEIGYYDYEYSNTEDDFLPLIRSIIEKYDTLIFATPVYWYSMSAIMKTFFDRFSDLIRIEKETGRKLRGKNMFVISSSEETDLDYDFYIPFKLSAEYLGMNYLGNKHISVYQAEDIKHITI